MKLSRTVSYNFSFFQNAASFSSEDGDSKFIQILVSAYESTQRHNPEENIVTFTSTSRTSNSFCVWLTKIV